ncbi:hypothetical protein CHCC5022_4310 [Bacillus paralicheniformis]|uniref:Uncharacterized protein n=1 Tax=Bacillus paralicheniformis TaxID=1648923 RepID=A0ABY3FQJ7_9BACI|nr:hypothetical protein SC10_B2orf04694 [Bacillus paralicheniformis]TWJ57841.1 hypothetical protein CHCC5022_4310 [Bacillus paralicheniformis]TWK23119.1 hypothetical protein CHCC20372_3526 [Bacillus paralicheniformis]TWL33838.1 hypothetical protein CHCC15381_0345 [Bacillus paralicheniformis]TWL54154.1 hypothetical protein CHCC15332_1071 [Bacillus paralicheniformis]
MLLLVDIYSIHYPSYINKSCKSRYKIYHNICYYIRTHLK